MGWYDEQVLPHLIEAVMRRPEFAEIRSRAAAGLEGEVLEIGFGSGLNVTYYPVGVTRVQAVDPALVGRRLAERRLATTSVPVVFVGLDGQALPLASSSIDHVLCTWTLCTIPDPARALSEIRRVLRPGGQLHLAEHGRSPDPGVARWQDRLTPMQRRVAGGCHLNRPIAELVDRSGLHVDHLDTYYAKGPRFLTYTFEMTATKQ